MGAMTRATAAGPRQSSRTSSPSDLHEAHQVTVVALGEHVLGRLLLEDAEDLGLQRGVRVRGGEQRAEGVDAVGEKAEAQLAAGRQAQPVALGAEGMGEGGDETHGPWGTGELERLG